MSINQENLIKIEDTINRCRAVVAEKYGDKIAGDFPQIEWTLRGKTAGRAWGGLNRIALHKKFLEHYGDEYINRTVVHEYAHLVQRRLDPYSQAHGSLWKSIMRLLGADTSRCHSYDTGLVVKQTKYVCDHGQVMNLGPVQNKRAVNYFKKHGTYGYYNRNCKCQTYKPA